MLREYEFTLVPNYLNPHNGNVIKLHSQHSLNQLAQPA